MKTILSIQRAFVSRKMAALLLLGFSSGLPLFLTSKTLQLWMQDAKVDLGTITLFGLMALPYSLKFLWSPLVDRFVPPFLGPRRGWLILTQVGLVVAIVAMALQQPSQNVQVLNILAITAFVISFLSATQDIVGDAYRTDVLQPLELETGASLWVLGYRVALFITSFLAIALADIIPWNAVYFLMAAFMAVGIITTLWAPAELQQRTTSTPVSPLSFKEGIFIVLIGLLVAGLLGGAISRAIALPVFYWVLAILLIGWIALSVLTPKKHLNQTQNQSPQSLQDAVILPLQDFFERFGISQASLILIFILLYKLGDALVGVTGNLFLREIGFSKTEIAAIQGVMGLIATTVGVLVGGIVMSKIGINRALWIFGVLQLVSNLGYYVLSVAGKNSNLLVLAINVENFCAGLVTVVTVAFLMSLCSHSFTTTQFALFSSLMAISRDILSAPSGDLAKATGWSSFFLLTLVAALPGLLLLPVIAPWNQHPKPFSRPGLDYEE
ncbi:AmpG family muropeptide MFS transporter [Tolypothrix campylonemoides VB511288_2]|uniref:AmpG family muropeptide MFS transporter n=4 Tax=Cyanophyceae TaxID=3028117 RepID=A0A0C1RG57_9CYAN|nr:AmpG family muropeptide MFS transporter [Tolypothrix bouteillei]KAF3887177.1 AmpG family muropeptide MFS transporter [Tolypothrix bouteillei VB521301]